MAENTSSAFIITQLAHVKHDTQILIDELRARADLLPQKDNEDAYRTDDQFRDWAELLDRVVIRGIDRRTYQQEVRAKTGR